ncbi:hypothetical protein V2O64_23250 [Verrucomicrobiaceae bacterium 227]
MKIRLLIGGTIAALALMAGFATGGDLAKADGKVSAKALPLDIALSRVPYETATFGMG